MKYYYPIDIDAVLTEDVGSFTDSHFAFDQNIEFAMTGISNTDRLKFLSAVTKIGDSAIVYVSAGTGTITIKKDSGASVTVASLAVGGSGAGWYIIDFGSDKSATQWFAEFSSVSGLQINEIFISRTFTFPYGYQRGNAFSKVYGVDGLSNSAGDEFTNKRHDAKWIRNWDWKNFDQTAIDAYDAFDIAVDGTRAKFLWFDDTDYWWVKNIVGINYTEAGCSAYDPRSGLRQQLN